MFELILSLTLIVACIAGGILYLNKSIDDYNRNLDATQSQAKKNYAKGNSSIKNEPCINCLA